MRSIVFWQEFAHVVVNRLVNPERGDPLLVVADTATDLNLAQACLTAGIAAGADSQMVVTARIPRNYGKDLGPSLQGAIRGSKHILVLGLSGNLVRDPAALEAVEKGARILTANVNGIEDYCLRAVLDLDIDRMVRNSERVRELWNKTKVCRVTSPQGTDIAYELMPRNTLVGDGATTYDGEIDFFPGAQVNIAPVEETINGVIVVDGSDVFNGKVHTPYALHIENGVITRIERDGTESAKLQDWLETTGAEDEKVYRLSHASVGMNPAAETSGNIMEDERKLAAMVFGFGFQYPEMGGTIGYCAYHWDVTLSTPTVYSGWQADERRRQAESGDGIRTDVTWTLQEQIPSREGKARPVLSLSEGWGGSSTPLRRAPGRFRRASGSR